MIAAFSLIPPCPGSFMYGFFVAYLVVSTIHIIIDRRKRI